MAFLQLLEDLRDDKLLAEDYRGAYRECLKKDCKHRICMMDRKDCIEDVCGIYIHIPLRLIAIRDKVSMGKHDTLWSSSRTGSEENRGKLIA